MIAHNCILLMILLHIIDDFVLQPICLSKLKQKDFWRKIIKDESYFKYDYIAALLIHGLSWSIFIHLPIIFTFPKTSVLTSVIVNALLHSFIDHLKCNKKYINLCIDQIIHIEQIIFTYLLF